jgi:ubiquinone/menaquinone biosynthesis C-methylase UbiE
LKRQSERKYGQVAKSTLSGNNAGVRTVAEAFGYTADELDSIPAEANMGLSCGNPTATASLKPGEVVVDLGSGGGLDVFLAAKKVGPTGKAIGIDMTPDMLARARKNAQVAGLTNVEFREGTIDSLPLPDNSVDCIISNCVINLAVDKSAVFREMFRVLKPGGRVAVSDLALKKSLPPEIAEKVMAYIGCIAGAIFIDDYRRDLGHAGFESVEIIDTHADLNAYASVEGQTACCSPAMTISSEFLPLLESGCCQPGSASQVHAELANLVKQYDLNEFAASVKVYALKSSGLA